MKQEEENKTWGSHDTEGVGVGPDEQSLHRDRSISPCIRDIITYGGSGPWHKPYPALNCIANNLLSLAGRCVRSGSTIGFAASFSEAKVSFTGHRLNRMSKLKVFLSL